MKYVFKKKGVAFFVGLVDKLGGALIRLFSRSSAAALTVSPKSVLVIRLDHIGDVLLSTAVPKAIKENFPGCRVVFLTASWSASLLQNNPFVDEIMLFDAPWFSGMRYKKSGKTLGFIGLLRALRRMKIDLGIALRGDLRENLMMFGAGIKHRIGYGITGGAFLLTQEVSYRRGVHESEHQKDLLEALGLKADSMEPKIYLSDHGQVDFSKKLERLGFTQADRYVCFLLNAGTPSKDWPVMNINQFIGLFINRFPGYRMVLVGSSRRIQSQLDTFDDTRVLDLVGETSLQELCFLAKKAAYFIGPDSGPTHIASALGTPTLFLYSGTNDFDRWKPLQEASIVVKNRVPCSPCESEVCLVEGHPCMNQILPENIIRALREKLL